MKMRSFLQNKMWRDKMIAMREEEGSILHHTILNDSEFDQQLRAKLVEEAHEVVKADSRDELILELADCLEVIDTLTGLLGISFDEVRQVQVEKKNKRGGFDSRKFITVAEHPVGSMGEQYCLNDPEKYPEVK